MSFQIQTQQISAGDSYAFTFPSTVGMYLYGISGFYLSAGTNTTSKLSTAKISLSANQSSDYKSITVEVTIPVIDDSSATNWVQVTVLAWLGNNNPPGIYLVNSTGIAPGAAVSSTALDNPPIIGAGILAGFDLSFNSGSSEVLATGAAVGCTISPFSTTPQAMPVGEGLLIGTKGDTSSNTVDAGLIILTQAQENVATGMYFDGAQNYNTDSTDYGTNNYSVNLASTPTQVAVFLQSFYLQFQITSSLNPTPEITYITAGASGITLADNSFSFTSTRMMYDSYYANDDDPIAVAAKSLAATYLYVALTGPTASGISPASGGTNGGTQVTITGENFTDGAVVYFGNAEATNVTVASSTSLTATVPSVVSAENVDVYVATPAGISQSLQFTYDLAVPTVTGVTGGMENSGPTSGGTPVTISGSGFANGGDSAITEVLFGSVAATGVTYDPDTQTLQATSPATTVSGPVDVYVTNSVGTSAQNYNDQFTYSDSSDIVVDVVKVDVVEPEDEKP